MTMPFSGKEFTFANPDGTEIRVRGWGDQRYAVFETLDGFTIVKDPESGYYQYARLSEDKNHLVPTGINVGEEDPNTQGLNPHVRIRREAARDMAEAASPQEDSPRRWEVRRAKKKMAQLSAPVGAEATLAPPSGTTVGSYVGLCLIVEFPDVPG